MAIEFKPGQSIRVTVKKTINRAGAAKTLERLFRKDKALVKALHVRSRHFKVLPKRRGGRIWTKYTNKLSVSVDRGAAATIKSTPQVLRDLNSVATFIEVTG